MYTNAAIMAQAQPAEIEPAPVMSIIYCKAKQSTSQAKKIPV